MLISFKFGEKLVYFQQALHGVGDERVEEDMLQDGLTPFRESVLFIFSELMLAFSLLHIIYESLFDRIQKLSSASDHVVSTKFIVHILNASTDCRL